MVDNPGEELERALFTRHAAFFMNGMPPLEQMSDVSDGIQNFLYPYFKNYIYTDPEVGQNTRLAIEKYLYEEDPIGISDREARNIDEYRPEAHLIVWLLITDSLNPKTLWALWILQFHAGISPYKSENDPKLSAMVKSLSEIYKVNRSKDFD